MLVVGKLLILTKYTENFLYFSVTVTADNIFLRGWSDEHVHVTFLRVLFVEIFGQSF